jgi:hypothetical protein
MGEIMYIKAINQEEAKYFFRQEHPDKVLVSIKQGGFSHLDEYAGKRVYTYKIKWKKREKSLPKGRRIGW